MDIHTIGNQKFAVEDRGTGEPILFAHGFPLDHTMWTPQLIAFQEIHRVIAPDLRGFGESTGDGEVHTMADFADDLANLLEQLDVDRPVTFCGLSMGGYIALEFARRHPDKLSRLILCDTKASPDPEANRRNRLDLAERVLKEGPEFFIEEMLEKLFSPAMLASSAPVVEETRGVMKRSNPAGVAAASRGMAERADFSGSLEEMTVPTLVLCGSEDAITTVEEMRELAERMPNARFIVIEGAGHMAPLEKPAAVNQAIAKFLGETAV